MTRKDFDQSLGLLEQKMLHMGSVVEQAVINAVAALRDQNLEQAERAILEDEQIDELSRELDEECVQILALHQPVARDLRAVTSILRTVIDLERIADHAVNIAEYALKIGNEPLLKPLIDIPRMAGMAMEMLHSALQAFVARDVAKAREIPLQDDAIDQIYADLYDELLGFIIAGSDNNRWEAQSVILLFTSHSLERIADHAVNICERLIYLETGKIMHF
jgi:phosphate transport system protein